MSAHTPGPWSIETWQIGEAKTDQVVVRATNDAIAYIKPLWVPDERVQETEANTNLICAAPDLLEALREASRWGNDFPDDVSLMVQNAIAKAEGSKP